MTKIKEIAEIVKKLAMVEMASCDHIRANTKDVRLSQLAEERSRYWLNSIDKLNHIIVGEDG